MDSLNFTYSDELYHHGILGQKWGVRRYQNPDGTLTAAGKKRAAKNLYKEVKKANGVVPNKTFESIEAIKRDLKEPIANRKKAQDEWDKAQNAFWRNEKLVRKYAREAAMEEIEFLGGEPSPATIEKEVAWYVNHAVYESKTGRYNEQYVHDETLRFFLKSEDGAKANAARQNFVESVLDYEDATEKSIEDNLGKYSLKTVEKARVGDYKLNEIVDFNMKVTNGLIDPADADAYGPYKSGRMNRNSEILKNYRRIKGESS